MSIWLCTNSACTQYEHACSSEEEPSCLACGETMVNIDNHEDYAKKWVEGTLARSYLPPQPEGERSAWT